jgi:hypothetical protein
MIEMMLHMALQSKCLVINYPTTRRSTRRTRLGSLVASSQLCLFPYTLSKICLFTRDIEMAARMENLHAPTVPSGPTSAPTTNGTQTNGLSFAELQAKKDALEAEIRALSSVLDSVGSSHISIDLALTAVSTALI